MRLIVVWSPPLEPAASPLPGASASSPLSPGVAADCRLVPSFQTSVQQQRPTRPTLRPPFRPPLRPPLHQPCLPPLFPPQFPSQFCNARVERQRPSPDASVQWQRRTRLPGLSWGNSIDRASRVRLRVSFHRASRARPPVPSSSRGVVVVALCRPRCVVSSSSRCCCVVVVFFFVASRRVVWRAWSIVVFTQQILPATHLIANSGDDTACRSIFLMRSRRQNRRWEKTARLIVATRAAGGGALKMRADGNGDRRQSLVRLFFLSFFALRVLSFPPD